jgi:S1-C subfamily serine protease
MKVVLGMALAFVVGLPSLGAGIATVEINGNEYTNVNDVHVSDNGRIFVSAANGMTVVSVDKLPEDFLKSWNINVESAKTAEKQKAEELLDKAIAAGYFREVDGVVYDTRKPQSGWSTFYNVKVIQVLDDGAIVDLTTDQYSTFAAHVKNLPNAVADTDSINFTAKLTGTYSYINKLGDDRAIRDYDVGRVCSRDEIPESVLSGKKVFDPAIQSGTPTKDVIATLPESDDLLASGTGFFITEDGYLVTNFHVVKDAKKVKVKNASGVYPAEVVHVDRDNDLALLKVSGKFNPLPISKDEPQLGEAVFTIGFPNIVVQGTEPKYTDGKISSLTGVRDDPKDYQISVPVQPGNSGGPLVDMNGNVIGVIVAKLNDLIALSSSGDLPQNVNYAVKDKYLNDFLAQFPEIHLNSTDSTSTNTLLSVLGIAAFKVNAAEPISSGNVVQSVQQSVAIVLVY